MTFKALADELGYKSVREMAKGEGMTYNTLNVVKIRDNEAGTKEDKKCIEIILKKYEIDGENLFKLIKLQKQVKELNAEEGTKENE